MIEIIPAMMPNSFEDVRAQASRVAGLVSWVQLDVMDGVFVTSKSWPYPLEGGENVHDDLLETAGLPFHDHLHYELDLMIARPEESLASWIWPGVKRLICHIESTDHFGAILERMQARGTEPSKPDGPETNAVPRYVEVGVAINIDTDLDAITPYLHAVTVVQCMGIRKLGYQGQPFDARVLRKIRRLRQQYPQLPISIDGGVNVHTAPALIEAGVNRLVSGSAIFTSDNIQETLHKFRALCREISLARIQDT